MILKVSDIEARLLDEVLHQHLRTLLREISHADDRAYRQDLRDRYERIEAIRYRLWESPEPSIGVNYGAPTEWAGGGTGRTP